MKLLDDFRNRRKKKVDVRSKPFTEKVVALLAIYGLPNAIDARFCSIELAMETYRYYKAIKKSGKDPSDKMTLEHGDKYLEILKKYGITDPENQDAFLCQYLDYLDEAVGC